jgi:RNA polymerase sigma factor (sigma-70 family)
MNGVLRNLRKLAFCSDGGGLTDGELMECFLARREEAAFTALVRRHGPMVLGVCRRVLRNVHDAEDAIQATFLVLARKAATVKPPDAVGAWLYGVAYRTARKARAMTAKRRRKEQEFRESRLNVKIPEDSWEELWPILDEELSRLPEKYQSAIVLCDLEGKTKKEAAGQLGCPAGTLSNWLARGRGMLARRLARRGVTLSAGLLAGVLSRNAASASLRAGLAVSTGKAAMLFTAGQTAGSVAVSAKAAALTEGVLKAMLLTKLKIATAVLVAFGMLCAGTASLLTHATRAAAQSQTATPQAAANGGGAPVVNAKPVKDNDSEDKPAWREILTMKHEHAINALACSADWSAAGDEGGKLFAWDTKTGKNRTPINSGWAPCWPCYSRISLRVRTYAKRVTGQLAMLLPVNEIGGRCMGHCQAPSCTARQGEARWDACSGHPEVGGEAADMAWEDHANRSLQHADKLKS